MATRLPTTLVGATKRFIDANPELTATDLPAVIQLKTLAKEIDADPAQGALQSAYGLIYRNLLKRIDAQTVPKSVDPLEALLTR